MGEREGECKGQQRLSAALCQGAAGSWGLQEADGAEGIGGRLYGCGMLTVLWGWTLSWQTGWLLSVVAMPC